MRWLAAAAGGLAALGWFAAAFAHAEPERATPGDGAVLNTPPGEIVLVMTQEMARQAGANDIDVLDAQGNEVTREPAVIDPADRRRLSVRLPADLPPGEYVVRWKTLSAEDGDTATGELRFRVDPSAAPERGRELLKESMLGGGPTPAAVPPPAVTGGAGEVGWVLVAAVGAVLFVFGLGAGVVFSRRDT
ncbi:copper resistance CopC family protein [Tepidiforma thermophila]|uniref:Methionine-rich copper-binding protein CopC n=1 Tax=Tepidiforma thermophila (strain KCTC 52669 / CGMCC 1.13589 / G233) TaxID=2761530 RepID=A0A2A9HIN8_TEPT2|nr:copper resistance CopC family protein [Tepidiforma thermophila]PFG74895.1 methionine-rich copper-binding protein CopC [Tepidiforma thermophila]